MSRDEKHLKPASTAITAGRTASGSSLAPALWGSSVWQSTCMDDANQRATSMRPGQFYGRYANPTVRSFEEAGGTFTDRNGVATHEHDTAISSNGLLHAVVVRALAG